MKDKDSSNADGDEVAAYWLTTVLEDRAETAGAPPVLPKPAPDDEEETER